MQGPVPDGPRRGAGRVQGEEAQGKREAEGLALTPTLTYQLEPELAVDEFIDLLLRSTLAERRPVKDRERMAGMLRQADLIATARSGPLLVGVSRALSDFEYCTYLADLAVDQAFQGQGIGRELIAQTHRAAGPKTMLILLAAPKAQTYYPHVGMTQHESCWFLPREG